MRKECTTFLTSWFLMTVSSEVVQMNTNVSAVERDNVTFTCSGFYSALTSWFGPDGSGQQIRYSNKGQTTIMDYVPQKNRLYIDLIQGDFTFTSLTIVDTMKTDTGRYECNEDGLLSYGFVFQVNEPSATVYVTQSGQSVIPCPLTSVINNVQWKGPPGITIYNSRGTTRLNINGLPADFVSRLAMNETTGALIINNTQRSDDNLYRCNVGVPQNYVQLTVVVSPQNPVITNSTEDIGLGRRVVRATEDNEVALICQVKGGNPESSVKWLRGGVTGSEVPSSNSSQRNLDGTYDVTSKVLVMARRSEDRVTYVCQAEHRTWTSLQNASLDLYLYLRPSEPVMVDPGNIQENATLSTTCSVSGCRPAATIIWSGAGTSFTTDIEDKATETFSVTSTYNKTVTRQDNGATLQCTITHPALSSSLVTSRILTVWFPPTSVSINNNIQVTEGESVILRCTTGVSNPAANMTWMNKTLPLSGGQNVDLEAEYGGTIRYQELSVLITRYMDGNIITCTSDNDRVTGGRVSNSTVMDIKYHPIATILNGSSITVLEGDISLKLVCSAESKPISHFTWRSSSRVLQYSGLLNENQDVYTITSVSRTHFGTYSCTANNSINPSGLATVSINVLFSPTRVSISNNIQVTAGDILVLKCTTGVSNPAANITWKNGTLLFSGGHNMDKNGEYGGTVRYQELTIFTNRYMDENIITCTADNDKIPGGSVSNSAVMDIKFSPFVMVSIFPSTLVTEGTKHVMFRCTAWSKPVSHFQLTKEDQNLPTSEGAESNEHHEDFIIATVNRTHAGTYSCLADNGVSGPWRDRQKSIELLVQYAPDISITVSNITIQDQTATLVCSPHGYPDNYTFRLWQHSWPGFNTTLRSLVSVTTSKTATLELHNITYEDSGIYTCQASNNIRVIVADQEFMAQSAYLLVKSAPKIVNIRENFEGRNGQSVLIQFDFYSNTEEKLCVTAERFNSSDILYEGTIRTIQLNNLSVKSFFVSAPGYRAILNIYIISDNDFGQYSIKVGNSIGSDVRSIVITAQIPASPENTSSIGVGATIGIGIGGIAAGIFGTIVVSTIRRRYNVNCSQWNKGRGERDDSIHTYNNTDVNLQPVSSPYEAINRENKETNVYDTISSVL